MFYYCIFLHMVSLVDSELRSFLQKGTRARPFLFWRVKGATKFDFGTFKGRLLLISAHLRGDCDFGTFKGRAFFSRRLFKWVTTAYCIFSQSVKAKWWNAVKLQRDYSHFTNRLIFLVKFMAIYIQAYHSGSWWKNWGPHLSSIIFFLFSEFSNSYSTEGKYIQMIYP